MHTFFHRYSSSSKFDVSEGEKCAICFYSTRTLNNSNNFFTFTWLTVPQTTYE